MSKGFKTSKTADLIRAYGNIHRQGEAPNIFLFASPRSGSTWLMQILHSQPGTKICSEPFDLRRPGVAQYFGTEDWGALYQEPVNPRIEQYLNNIIADDKSIGFLNMFPFRHEHYRFKTDRIVFKVLHALEDRLDWIKDTYQAKVIWLLRHPIAVSLSREVSPRLDAFLQSDYTRHFNAEQLAYARKLAENGTEMEKNMLDWCLQNAVTLKQVSEDWIVLTYEQLTVEPELALQYLQAELHLSGVEDMKAQLLKPSSSTVKSDAETQARLQEEGADRTWLIEKWRKKVDEQQEYRLMEILDVFEMDVYTPGSYMPTEAYLLGNREAV